MQIIFVFSTPGYTGSASSPTLKLMTGATFAAFYPGLQTPATVLTSSMYSAASQGRFSLFDYGNWCGPDYSGGFTGNEPPIDSLDSACQVHDRAYGAADATWGSEYANATTQQKRVKACQAWFSSYKSADDKLSAVALRLPREGLLEQSMARGDIPDVWGFDARVYGPHERTGNQRDNYRVHLLGVRLTQTFRDPDCNRKP